MLRQTRQTLATRLIFWVIVSLACGLRLFAYGDPRLSVATLDTGSYIESARVPLLSWQALTAQRLFTTNVVFKLVSGNPGCTNYPISMPAIGKEIKREVQPCFTGIALLQVLLSLASWVLLAVVVARHLTNPFLGIVAAGLITLFGFTPQIAAWDSVMGSESLSLSLLALSFGCLIEAIFAIVGPGNKASRRRGLTLALGSIVFTLWIFTKDASLFAVPTTLLLLAPIPGFGVVRARRPALLAILFLVCLLALGLTTSAQSQRWRTPLQGSFESFVLPYPERVQFMQQRFAMPDAPSVAYESWFGTTSRSAYMAFLVLHPGFIANSIRDNRLVFVYSYQQPYFEIPSSDATSALERLGRGLHPGSAMIYLADTIAVIVVCTVGLRQREHRILCWAWILAWLYLAAAITLFVTYFADAQGVMRHVFPSLEMFRLLMWLSLIVLAEMVLHPPERKIDSQTQPPSQPAYRAS